MRLLDLFNQICYLEQTIKDNREQLKSLGQTHKDFNPLFIETLRLIDELNFYTNQLDEIDSTVVVSPYR